jgi:hypothetical protein
VNKKTQRTGGALIIVMITVSILMLTGFGIYRSVMLLTEIVNKKQQYEQRLYFAQGLLNYGVALCRENADVLYAATDKKHQYVVSVQVFNRKGIITLTASNDVVYVQGAVHEQGHAVGCVRCAVRAYYQGTAKQRTLIREEWAIVSYEQ